MTPPARSFGYAGKEFLKFRHTKKSPRTAGKHAWLFQKLRPLHDRPLAEIKAPEVMKVLRALEADGQAESARRAGQFCARVFRHAIREGWCEYNPATDLRGGLEGVVTTNHPAITDPAKFGQLMRAVDTPGFSHGTVYNALRLLARTALRPGELRQGLWSEIDFGKAEWRIPAPRMKMRREHLVPLSRQAIEILKVQQHDISQVLDDLTPSPYIFPGLRTGRPISDAAMGISLKNMFISPDEHVPHGFRSSFSTLMNEAGTDASVIELQLSHAKRDKIAGIYDRSQRVPERKKLMQAWADYIDQLKESKP
jgi:integrase